jgi:hypothetical protein
MFVHIIIHNMGIVDLILTQHSLSISCDLIKVMEWKKYVLCNVMSEPNCDILIVL